MTRSDTGVAGEDLRESILWVVDHNTGGLQAESVSEYVIVGHQVRRGHDSATVRNVLATLVEEGHLDRLDGKREPRYRLGGSTGSM